MSTRNIVIFACIFIIVGFLSTLVERKPFSGWNFLEIVSIHRRPLTPLIYFRPTYTARLTQTKTAKMGRPKVTTSKSLPVVGLIRLCCALNRTLVPFRFVV